MGASRTKPTTQLTRERTLRLTETASALTHLVASLEFLTLEQDRQPGGLNNWDVAKDSYRTKSMVMRRIVQTASRPRVTRSLYVAQAAAALALLCPTSRRTRFAANTFLAGTSIALHPRHRYGGDGSDQMRVLVQTTAALARATDRPALVDSALWYLTAQGSMSYAVSGWAKLCGPLWRNGDALTGVMRTVTYGDERFWRLLRRYPRSARLLGGSVLAMECLFPVALIGPGRRLAPLFVVSAASFHLANARLMGLHRFATAFLAVHPPVLYCAGPRLREVSPGQWERRDDHAPVVMAMVGAVAAAAMVVAQQRRKQLVTRGRDDQRRLVMSSGNVLSFRRDDAPDPGATLVVLESGLSSTQEHWEWVRTALGPHVSVLTYDRAGYGASTHAAGATDLSISVDDLTELIATQAQGRPVVLVGHSLGGYLAWRAAARDCGGAVRGVVLLDSSHPRQLDIEPDTGPDAYEELFQYAVPSVRLGLGVLLRDPRWLPQLPADVRALTLAQWRDARLWVTARREWTAAKKEWTTPGRHTVADVGVPVLALTAANTAADSPDILALHQDMASFHPASRSALVDGADHQALLWRERSARHVAGLILQFAAEVCSSTTPATHATSPHASS